MRGIVAGRRCPNRVIHARQGYELRRSKREPEMDPAILTEVKWSYGSDGNMKSGIA